MEGPDGDGMVACDQITILLDVYMIINCRESFHTYFLEYGDINSAKYGKIVGDQ